MSVEHSWYAPAYISRVCRALPYIDLWRRLSQTHARAKRPRCRWRLESYARVDPTAGSCRLAKAGSGVWTRRYCHMSSDRLVAQQIKRQEVSDHVSTAVIGRWDEASPQRQNLIVSEQEGLKSGEGKGVVEYEFRCS